MGSNKLLIGGLVAAVLAAGAYFMFLRGDDTGPVLSTEGGIDTPMSASAQADREFLQLLNELSSIQLDASYFKDPLFTSLLDFRVEPVRQPVGRSNPFAPAR